MHLTEVIRAVITICTLVASTLFSGDPSACEPLMYNRTYYEDTFITEDTTWDESVLICHNARLEVYERLTVTDELSVDLNSIDLTHGRLRLVSGSRLKFNDIIIEVSDNDDQQPKVKGKDNCIELYERNGKLKFTNGINVKTMITMPEGLPFDEFFSVTNLSNASVFCNGEEVDVENNDISREVSQMTRGEYPITEDTVVSQNSQLKIDKDVTLSVVSGNHLNICCMADLYGRICADREDFETSSFWINMHPGSEIDLSGITVRYSALNGAADTRLCFRADGSSSTYELEDGTNARIDITIPENTEFEDYFSLENCTSVEIYINGSNTKYIPNNMLSRLSLTDDKEIIVKKDQSFNDYVMIPSGRTVTVLPGATLSLKGTAQLNGELHFDNGCFYSDWMWFNPGATIMIDNEITITCRENKECNELNNRIKSVIFMGRLNGHHIITNGYACIIDITMPEGGDLNELFSFSGNSSGMIVRVNGRQIDIS